MLMDRARAHLLVIDVQEKLAPHIAGTGAVTANCLRLIACARRLGVPVTITEQYPKGLGPTVQSLVEAAGNETPRLEKITFSCWREQTIRARIEDLAAAGRDQLVVVGTETHVCVGQTVLELRANGHQVYVVADAVGSRTQSNRDLALARFSAAGASIVATEMVAFEWLERAATPEFRDVLALVK
ncbi:MAG: hydrolase [Proteobacteria bacterium]|nr:hydrolase [Pseudomonadota bacterium]